MGGAMESRAVAGVALGILMTVCRGADGPAPVPSTKAPSAVPPLQAGAAGSTNAAPAKGSAGTAATLEEDGVAFVHAAGTTFRWKGWLDVYDVDLRLGPGTLREKPLEGGAVRLEFKYHRPFSARQVAEGGNALLEKNVSPDEWKALQPSLERLNRAYVSVQPGDRYTLTHVPGRGLTLRLNGKPLVTVEGDDFGPKYLRIWLGREPIHKGLRDRLLGAAG
jgi:hypothetical protein